MLIRYRRSEDGKLLAKAVVYTQAEHKIERSGIDPDALRIVERLRENGHEAYIVGGAVRDLLLGRRPKDFDIVTDAQPSRIKRVFRSARIIGQRFRLVHVYAGPNIFEVSTFRSIANGTIGNEFGTIDEDAHRRDFSLNALYFDPHDSTLVDYVGGFNDIMAKRIEPVIPLKTIFKEDAVRMIRCVKDRFHDRVQDPVQAEARAQAGLAPLGRSQPFAAYRGILRFLGSGSSAKIVEGLARYDLLRHILPECAALMAQNPSFGASLRDALAELDAHASDPSRDRALSVLLAHYLKAFLECGPDRIVDTPDAYREAVHESRLFLSPLNPPRVELEAAVLVVFKRRGISPMQRPRKWLNDRGDFRAADSPRKDMGRRGVPLRQPEKPAALLGEAAPMDRTGEGEPVHAGGPAKRRRRRNRNRHKPQGGEAR